MKPLNLFRALTLSVALVLSSSNLQPALSAPHSKMYDGIYTATISETCGDDFPITVPDHNFNFVIENNNVVNSSTLRGTVDIVTGNADFTSPVVHSFLVYKSLFVLDEKTGIVSVTGTISGEIRNSSLVIPCTGTIQAQSKPNKLKFTLKSSLPTAYIGKKYTPFSLCNDNKPVPKGHACGGLSRVSNPSGGVPPYTFRVTGILPRLTLNSRTGVISGTPTGIKSGTYKLTICAYDMQDAWNGVCWKTSITYKK